MTPKEISTDQQMDMNVVLFRESNGDKDLYVMQGLQFDICTQGETLDEVFSNFQRVTVGQIMLDIRNKRQPLAHLGRAPQEFWDRAKKGKTLRDPIEFHVESGRISTFAIEDVQAPRTAEVALA